MVTKEMTGPEKDTPRLSLDTARALLRHVMEWDSEETTFAGWESDNEYRIWSQVVRDPVVAGELVDRQEYTWLRELAGVAGGWWVWPRALREGPCFVSMDEWLPGYQARHQKMIEEDGPGGWGARRPIQIEENAAFWKAYFKEGKPCSGEPTAEPDEGEGGL
jgi:hypothetical protein